MKAKITQDFLYDYLTAHDVNLSCIARLSGMSYPTISSSFLHHKDKMGKPRYFSSDVLNKLNVVVQEMSEQLQDSLITFGSPETYTNRWGNTYDPGTMPAIKHLSKYFNLTGFVCRVLGWDAQRKGATFSGPSTKRYGRISADDVSRINAEVLAVAGFLGGIEVVPEKEQKEQKESHHVEYDFNTDEMYLEEMLLLEGE